MPDIKIEESKHSLAHRMLVGPLRDYVIESLKKPLVNVIILVGQRYRAKFGEITKDTVTFENTKVLIDFWDKFFEYDDDASRTKMFHALRDISVAESEHDFHYVFRFGFLIEAIIKAILEGRWQPRPEGCPISTYWREPKPYGGKHSIIWKMWKHREEILKILEERQ